MIELSAFASLAQFGAGLGLALSFFLEPVTARARSLRSALNSEFSLIPQSDADTNRAKRSEIWLKIISLDGNYKNALSKSKYPILFIKIGSIANLIVLIMATVAPDSEVSFYWMWAILLTCIAPIAVSSTLLFYIGMKYIPDPSELR